MIIGEHIRLRSIDQRDLSLFTSWLNDPEVRQYLDLYLPLSMEEEVKWFEGLNSRPADERPLMIEFNTPDGWVAVGNVSLMNIDWRNRLAEIGIVIGEKRFWNQGIGRQTMSLMIKHGFETLNLNRIFLRVYEPNERGIRAYENAGFIHEGRMRQAVYINGNYHDVLLMSVMRADWEKKQTNKTSLP
jgi:diamine N-acetyltransferase